MKFAWGTLLIAGFAMIATKAVAEDACVDSSLNPSSQSSVLKETLFQTSTPDEAKIQKPDRDQPRTINEGSESTSPLGDYVVARDVQNRVVGFAFKNVGPNSIVPVKGESYTQIPSRDFSFNFVDRARQEITLSIVDKPYTKFSEHMRSELIFLPRKVLPAIQWDIKESPNLFRVILPNGEGIYYDKKTKAMVGGALVESGPMDRRQDKASRQFPSLSYQGAGVMIRVDKRGESPRKGTTASVYKNGQVCRVPSSKLFNQSDSDTAFKFPTDSELDAFLQRTCGFGLQ